MLTLPYVTAFLLCAVALFLGVLAGWACFRLRAGSSFISTEIHQQDMLTMRRRYRRRLRTVRDTMLRHKLAEKDLRSQLQVAGDHHQVQDRLLASAQAQAERLGRRVADLEAGMERGRLEADEAAARVQALASQLKAAQARIAGYESEHGLLRIERDELAAHTQRLQALRPLSTGGSTGAAAGGASGSEPPAGMAHEANSAGPPVGGASRTELADRDARIHELQCQLQESQSRVSEMQSSLNTWKYRIAPLALHMKMQREKAHRQKHAARAKSSRPPAPDDLQLIRGIGRGLEKKLRAQGVQNFSQLATMSPAELASLAVRAGVAASRPVRDRWADQARQLGAPPSETEGARIPGELA